MQNAQLKNILYRYANTKGVGTPLTAEEMLNAISSWLVDTLPECIDVEITSLPATEQPTVTLTGKGTPDDHYLFSFGIPMGVSVTDVQFNGSGGLTFTLSNGTTIDTIAIAPTMEIGTVESGDTPSASITGTYPNYVINLVLPKGADAVNPNLYFTVTTLEAGAEATCNVTGTYPDLTIALGIPRGQPGLQGIQGEKGDPGDNAENPNFSFAITTLEAGSSATLNVSGTYPNLLLTFGIPRGADGENADEPNFTFDVTTLEAGSSATLTVTGTYPDLTLTFGIPQGEKGDKGDKGDGVNYMGDWVENNSYVENDIVYYAPSSYICISDISGSSTAPDEDTEHWQLFARGNAPSYVHIINIDDPDFTLSFQLINDSPDEITYDNLRSYLYDNGFISTDIMHPAIGYISGTIIYGLLATSTYVQFRAGATTYNIVVSSGETVINDTVVELS